MAETIEHRLQTLIDAGIPIYTVRKNEEQSVRRPFTSMTSSEHRPDEGLVRNLGYFANRGFEQVEGWISSTVTDGAPRLAAMVVGALLELKGFGDYSNDVDLEIHSIHDPQGELIHYFLLPHRRCLE
jgi:hypothetical protein